MPGHRCSVQDCDNEKDDDRGISLHRSPTSGRLYYLWKRFVSTHRKDFSPVGEFPVCSVHFTADCFTQAFHVKGTKRVVKKGSVPIIWKPTSPALSARDHRMVSEYSLSFILSVTAPLACYRIEVRIFSLTR